MLSGVSTGHLTSANSVGHRWSQTVADDSPADSSRTGRRALHRARSLLVPSGGRPRDSVAPGSRMTWLPGRRGTMTLRPPVVRSTEDPESPEFRDQFWGTAFRSRAQKSRIA